MQTAKKQHISTNKKSKKLFCCCMSFLLAAAFFLPFFATLIYIFPSSAKAQETEVESTHTLLESYIAANGNVYTVILKYETDAGIPDTATLKISEPSPDEYSAYLEQTADVLLCDESTLASIQLLDIFISDGKEEIQPKASVNVIISKEDVPIHEDTQVVHFGEEVEIIESETVDGELHFEADGFSVFAITNVVIETVISASDSERYLITAVCPPDSGVSSDASLIVEEIADDHPLYNDYIARAESSIGWGKGEIWFAHVFDIKIVDAQGQKIEVAAPVEVHIDLLSEDGIPEDAQVVHFADTDKEGEIIDAPEIIDETIIFQAPGFSAYAIVAGPDHQAMGWTKIDSMADFGAYAKNGLYIGHINGYYFKNIMVSDSGTNPRTGIGKTKPAAQYPDTAQGAVKYYFEPASTDDQYYIYCYNGDGSPEGNEKQYVSHVNDGTTSNLTKSLLLTDEDGKTAFTVSLTNKGFTINDGAWYWNMQGSANGTRFCVWNAAADTNNYLTFWNYVEPGADPFHLDKKKYGLMNFSNGVSGIGMMSTSSKVNHLDALYMTVLTQKDDSEDRLFVPNNTDLSMWTFHWVENAGDGNVYTLSTEIEGETKYLNILSVGLSLSDTPVNVQIIPGTGFHTGEICLKSEDGFALTYCGSVADGFSVGNTTAGSEWLSFVEKSLLTEDYYMTYTADKISVSDPAITNGSKIIIYTRSWNEAKKRYEFYAIAHDGSLVPVYESGNSIQWVGSRINTLLWDFTKYYWENTTEPNDYYELYNEYSQKYIAPQLIGNQILSYDKIGINLNGRKQGSYYSTILAWDDASYAYAGLKVVGNHIITCPKEEAMDFYFAIMQEQAEDDSLHSVPTIDNTLYGISMKIIDFNTLYTTDDGLPTSEEQHNVLGDSTGGAVKYPNSGLLSTNLGPDGYPIASKTGISLSELYKDDKLIDVNHLFVKSTYEGSGYFEFDSSQNSATLIDPITGAINNNFTVYRELATHDKTPKTTLKHGQFFPFNEIFPGHFAESNAYNNYDVFGIELPNSDPRKGERLYKIDEPNCYFGMELEANFVQTPNGKDSWDHDIIYEFTGDDDFWLYVDRELVLDLGGIHSAIPGTVNFSTGEVKLPDSKGVIVTTTLYDIFRSNYETRGMDEVEINEALEEIFKEDNGHRIFKDYTTHTMKIFYMERGAGASNLHMRFNLSSVKKGTVQLSKKLSGVDTSETVLAEFAYQIYYTTEDNLGNETEHLLTNEDTLVTPPVYKGTMTPVRFLPNLTIDGISYNSVYMLKPKEIAEIEFPDRTMSYRIIECGIDTNVYSHVYVNDEELIGEECTGNADRSDFGISDDSVENRTSVIYDNEVRNGALRKLTIIKKLYDVTGANEIHYDPDNPITFNFRLYFSTEFESTLTAADMFTYHVKDENGNYCKWDSTSSRFVSLGKNEYSLLTDSEKTQASFATSQNGSISKIPAFYTIEIREVLAGTQYKVEERDYEIPDGYSRLKYVLYNESSNPNGIESAATAPTGTMPSDKNERDPHIDVCNVKGFGLRVYKEWSDENYMSYRDPTYFAVFINDEPLPVPGTLRQLPVGAKTLYWYFDTLASGCAFADYTICEVAVTNPSVDVNGCVVAYDDLDRIGNNDSLIINGTQKGDDSTSAYTYQVQYDTELEYGTNVRIYNVSNVRDGIAIRKLAWGDTDEWGGEGLFDGKFELSRGDQQIGIFTSDATGWVTEAYLSEGVTYTLTETKAPQGHYGLQTPLTLTLNNGMLTVAGEDIGFYRVLPATADGPQTLEIRNRSYNLRFVKQDGSKPEHPPLEGVHFALHKEVTVGGVSQIDFHPMTGYEDLITDANGIIPLLDNTLAPGTYSLHEIQALPGYETMTEYLDFHVDNKGNVTVLDEEHQDWFSRSMIENTIVYSFSVPNVLSSKNVRLVKVGWDSSKTNAQETSLAGAVFNMYEFDGVTPLEVGGIVQQNLISGQDGVFFDGALVHGTYYIEEVSAPIGYDGIESIMCLTIDENGAVLTMPNGDPVGTVSTNMVEETGQDTRTVYTLTIRNEVNGYSYELPLTGGNGIFFYLLLCGVFIVLFWILSNNRFFWHICHKEIIVFPLKKDKGMENLNKDSNAIPSFDQKLEKAISLAKNTSTRIRPSDSTKDIR